MTGSDGGGTEAGADCYRRVDKQARRYKGANSHRRDRPHTFRSDPPPPTRQVDLPPFAVISRLPLLFSTADSQQSLLHLLSPPRNRVFHLSKLHYELPFLSPRPTIRSHFSPPALLLLLLSLHRSAPDQPLGHEINDVPKALAMFAFQLSKLNRFRPLVYIIYLLFCSPLTSPSLPFGFSSRRRVLPL